MKFLVIGLGSMGKRRVRNLQAIGGHEVAGFDPREDRRQEAHSKYQIPVFANFEEALANFAPTGLVISTPPDKHMQYAYQAFDRNLHAFIEASVVDSEKILALHEKVSKSSLVIVPSCTMQFFPAPAMIKRLVKEGAVGKPLTFTYHSGQYLPDWHPWEDVRDFYVSNRATGGCREIVPFEMTWLNDLFGEPEVLGCAKAKLTDIPAPIDDVYHCLMRYPNNVVANLVVDVIARPKAIREFKLLGSEGQIHYSSETNELRVVDIRNPEWKTQKFDLGHVEKMYINPEGPYIQEMTAYVNAIIHKDRALFPNDLKRDYHTLVNLYDLEKLTGDTHELPR